MLPDSRQPPVEFRRDVRRVRVELQWSRPAATERKDAVVPSPFVGTDGLICKALRIQRRNQLKSRSLPTVGLSDEGAICLVSGLYERMAANIPARIARRSRQLWHCRRAGCFVDCNPSQKIVPERAVAKLAECGHMPGNGMVQSGACSARRACSHGSRRSRGTRPAGI